LFWSGGYCASILETISLIFSSRFSISLPLYMPLWLTPCQINSLVFAQRRLENMLFWDVNNGIARRSWARNKEAVFAIKREMKRNPNLKVTLPNFVDDALLN